MHPQQRDCDPDDPKTMAAWCFAAGIPDPRPAATNNIPLVLPQLVGGISDMLYNFGFRHHPDLQTKWIEGAAGMGTIAQLVDQEPRNFVEEAGQDFLAENNPQLMEAIKNASPEQRAKLFTELQKNFEQIEKVMALVKKEEDGGSTLR